MKRIDELWYYYHRMELISVVIPVYGCATCLVPLTERLTKTLSKISKSFEIILVDDNSHDGAWEIIQDLSKSNHFVKGILLSRNFGQHHAITAGLDNAKGNWIVVMDCDLQDQPEDIPLLYKEATKNFDIVFARRVNRQDNLTKKIIAYLFHRVFELLSGMKGDPAIGNFGMYSRIVIDNYKKIRQQNLSFLQTVKWMGFRQSTIIGTPAPRLKGKSGYNLKKLISYAIDCITAYSNTPLWFPFIIGKICIILSLIYIVLTNNPHRIPNNLLLIPSLYFLSGIILVALGTIGIYIGKIFDEVRHRPLYIIKEKIGIN